MRCCAHRSVVFGALLLAAIGACSAGTMPVVICSGQEIASGQSTPADCSRTPESFNYPTGSYYHIDPNDISIMNYEKQGAKNNPYYVFYAGVEVKGLDDAGGQLCDMKIGADDIDQKNLPPAIASNTVACVSGVDNQGHYGLLTHFEVTALKRNVKNSNISSATTAKLGSLAASVMPPPVGLSK